MRPDRPGGPRPGIAGPGPGRPGEVRPGPGRPGGRPVDIRNRPIDNVNVNVRRNNVINNRPNWVRIDNNRRQAINTGIRNQIGGVRNWQNVHRDRIDVRHRWGNDVRNRWRFRRDNWFGPDWWARHRHAHGFPGWRYHHAFHRHPWAHWWRAPVFASFVTWFAWAPSYPVWQEPIYYDYGPGGNVYYENDVVYFGGEQIATAGEFAESAMTLATVAPPASEEEAAAAEWMPLGTFAVSTGEEDVDPTRVIQLAVDKEGVISGTMYNEATDQAYAVQGQVDKETQRVAFRVGESETLVLETGLYNLTQDEAPVLAHYGTDRTENWLFVRLDAPEESMEESPVAAPAPPAAPSATPLP